MASACSLQSIPQTTTAAYTVFSDDSSKVELFLPEQTVILDRHVKPNGTSVWNIEDDDTYMLEHYHEEWITIKRNRVLYTSTEFKNMHKATMVNDKNKILSITFFTRAGIAQVTYDGIDYILYQYSTASDYGYKNPFIDIRGKGRSLQF